MDAATNWILSCNGSADGVTKSLGHETKGTPRYIASYGDNLAENALIKSDNIIALNWLAQQHPGTVRCVYMDPPYNNGESYRHYYDSLGHDEWLRLLNERLRQVYTVLSSDGSVWISIDDSELHYLKVMADGIFGRDNFVSTIIWQRRKTRENRKVFSRSHEYLLVYAKNRKVWEKRRNALPLTSDILGRYKNPDNDIRGPWQSVSANVQDGHATPQQIYSFNGPNGKAHTPPKGRCWVYTKPKMLEEIEKGNIWFGADGNGVPRIKKFLKDRKEGLSPETLWFADDVGTTSDAKKHLIQLFESEVLFDTPKPEQLIQRILQIATDPGDLVLDPYLGSGTTAAVAHKMQRRYIGIELGEHIKSHCIQRIKKVISGEPAGISDVESWCGGGGFKYYEFD